MTCFGTGNFREHLASGDIGTRQKDHVFLPSTKK